MKINSLLSHVYKLFMRIITKRIANKLDYYEPREEVRFRAGFGTNDHLLVMKVLIEKSIQYNKLLILIFVDYEKAFDIIKQQIMLQSLSEARIDHRYTKIIKNIYGNAKATVRLHEDTADFHIKRGVWQGDVILPKLFTALMKFMFKKVDFGDVGINIDEEKLNYLRFADEIVLIADRVDVDREMLRRLNEVSNLVGFLENGSKTQFITNLVVSEGINLNGSNL